MLNFQNGIAMVEGAAVIPVSRHQFWHGVEMPVFPHSDLPLPFPAVDNSIMVFEAALSDDECDVLIRDFESCADVHFEGAVMVNGVVTVDPVLKKNTELFVSEQADLGSKRWTATDALLSSCVQQHLLLYQQGNAILSTQQNPFSDEGFRIKRYESGSGEHHAYHSDCGHETASKPHRILAVLLYLNTVETGGETVFLNHGITIQPKRGRLAIFPTAFSFVHAGKRPVSEDKYLVINFLTT